MLYKLNFYSVQEQALFHREQNLHRQPLTRHYHFFRNKSGYTNIVSKTLAVEQNKELLPFECRISFHPDDIEEAFKIATNHLLKLKDSNFYFSIADPMVETRPGGTRNQITLYCFKRPDGRLLLNSEVLSTYLNQLEQSFISKGIRPNPNVNEVDRLPGSNYIQAVCTVIPPFITAVKSRGLSC